MAPNCYALRVDYGASDKQRLSDWLSANCGGYLVCYEEVVDENPHVHVVLYSEKNIDTLRKSFKRAFDDKRGNGAYSLKACDANVDDYIAYICKGVDVDSPPDVILKQGIQFDDEYVEGMHQRYWDRNAQLVRAAGERAAARGNMVEVVEKLCREQGVRSYERKKIALVYIRQMRAQRKAINIFAARAVVNGVVVALDEEESGATEEIAIAIANI